MISFDLTPKTKTIKAKIKSGTTSNLKSFSIAEENIKKRKGNLLNGRKYLQINPKYTLTVIEANSKTTNNLI